jgi:hypothetical protein
VLDPPKLGYWMDSPKWDLDGRRPGKAETMADSRNPRKTCTHVGLGTAAICVRAAAERQGRSQEAIWCHAVCWCSPGFAVTLHEKTIFLVPA